jgi:hypothetical protein
MSDDEAIYAVVAREMLAGQALYRDVIDHKPPGIYVVYEATQAIAGPTGGMLLLHALLILTVWATGLLLCRVVRESSDAPASDQRAPWLAALFWIVFTTTLVDVDALAANCELFMMLPVVGSVVAFVTARSPTRLILAGALVGIGMLFKYQAGIQLPLYAVAWVAANRANPRCAVLGLFALGVGVAIPIAGTMGVLAACGTLSEARFWFLFNFSYINAGPALGEMLVRGFVRAGLIVGSGALLYGLAIRGAFVIRGSRFGRFAIGWAIVSVFAVGVGGRFFGHYFHQLTAPLCVLAAPIAVRFLDRHRAWFVAGMAIPAAAFLVLGAIHDRVMIWAGEPDPDYAHVVEWLDQGSPRMSSICVWGNSPVLYFEAERPLGCRFSFANYLTGLVAGEPRGDAAAHVVPEAWDLFEDDLARRQPEFIIDGSPGNVAYYGSFAPENFPRLERVLRCQYTVVGTVEGMRVFRRLRTPACSPG